MFILLVICTVPVFNQIVNLSKLPRTSSNHPWVLAYDNKVMVVWREEGGYTGDDNNIYYTVFSGTSWSKPRAAYNTGEFSKNPHMDMGADGVIHLVWADGAGSNRDVFYGKYKNGAWQGSRAKVFSSPYNSNWQRIGIYQNNVLNVVWGSAMTGGISQHWRIRNTWKIDGFWNSTGKILSKNATWTGDWDLAMHPDIFCKGDKAYVVWHEGNHSTMSIKFSEKQGNGDWSYPIDITPTGKMYNWPGIVVDSSDNVHVICSKTGGNVWSTSRRSGTWSALKPINQSKHTRGFVTLDIDDKDVLHAVYQAGSYIYYNYGSTGGNWGQETKVSNGKEDMYPAVAADNNGFVHVVWCEADEGYNGDVYYSKLEAGYLADTNSPTASFTHTPQAGAPPLKVYFDAAGSSDSDGTIESYSWDFGDGFYGDGLKPTHTFTKRDVYTVTLTVVDNDGLSATAKGNVYVSDPPVAKFTITPPTGVAPVTINFDASTSYDPDGKIVKYRWDYGDNTFGNGEKTAHNYEAADDYTVTLEVFDNYGIGTTASKEVQILRVYPPLDVQYGFKVNRNLFSIEYYSDITWTQNPGNVQYGINIVAYKVYRREKGSQTFLDLASVSGDTFFSWDRRLEESDENRFEYRVTALDDLGNESYLDAQAAPAAVPRKQKIRKKE
jgi:PKD repeat protein